MTDADRVAAKLMLEHAFRHVSTRALKDVDFADIVDAFATHAAQAHAAGRAEGLEEAEEVAIQYPASGGYRQIGRNIATAIRARITTTGGGENG